METNRSIFQAVWPHLRPVSQRRIRMVCKSLHEWSQDWERNVPDLNELKNHNNWKTWFEEAKLSMVISSMYRWAWLDGCVSLVVIFVKIGGVVMLKIISTQYEISNHPDYSHASIEVLPDRWMPGRTIGGKKVSKLPVNRYSAIYKQYRDIVTSCDNIGIKLQFFPYCECIDNRYQKEVFWRKARYYKGNRLIIKEMYVCKDCAEINKDLN